MKWIIIIIYRIAVANNFTTALHKGFSPLQNCYTIFSVEMTENNTLSPVLISPFKEWSESSKQVERVREEICQLYLPFSGSSLHDPTKVIHL